MIEPRDFGHGRTVTSELSSVQIASTSSTLRRMPTGRPELAGEPAVTLRGPGRSGRVRPADTAAECYDSGAVCTAVLRQEFQRYFDIGASLGGDLEMREVSVIHRTMLSPRRSTACSKPRSFTGAVLGGASRRSSSPPSNGSTGSTSAGCSSRSATCLPPRPKHAIMPRPRSKPWLPDPNHTASGKPGAAQ